MKVLATIVIAPHLSFSGAVRAAKELSVALAKHCDIDIAIMSEEKSEEKLGEALLLKRKSTNPLWFTKNWLPDKYRTLLYKSDIPDLIQQGKYDLVHIHNPIPTMEMKRISKACLLQNIPYVISTHGFVEVTSKGEAYSLRLHERLAWKYFIEKPLKFVIDNARMIFALSPAEIPILENLGVLKERIEIVTNGVNKLSYKKLTVEEIEKVCNKYKLPKIKPLEVSICFFLGNHTKNKGLNVLLDAFLLTDKPYILIVGGKKRANIQYEAYSSRCANNQLIVFTDQLTDEETRAFYQYADLFVFPTLGDTFPLVILEAMASNLPILATKVGGIPYQVDESCGCLVEPNNPIAFKDGFEYLTEDKEKLYRMGLRSGEIVQSSFDWEKSAEKAYSLYKHILREVYDGTLAVK